MKSGIFRRNFLRNGAIAVGTAAVCDWSGLYRAWDFCPVDIMDEDGAVMIPVGNGKRFREMSVGRHMLDYDSMVVLTHFKGHAMGGFGGSLKNIAIGCADGPIGKKVVHAAPVKARDLGIPASTDLLAIEQASIDMVYALPDAELHDLRERIESRKGLRQLSYMKEMKMGNDIRLDVRLCSHCGGTDDECPGVKHQTTEHYCHFGLTEPQTMDFISVLEARVGKKEAAPGYLEGEDAVTVIP